MYLLRLCSKLTHIRVWSTAVGDEVDFIGIQIFLKDA